MAIARSRAVVAAGSLLAVVAFVSVTTIGFAGNIGDDYDFYSDIGARWLAGVPYYLPYQLDPHDFINMGDNLYPPSALPLFVGAAVLPPIVWWIVPIGVLAYVMVRWRPGLWAVAAMLFLLAWPRAHGSFLWGNTDMWMAAGVAAGLRWGWPAMVLTIKPSLALFAIVGYRRRSFWLAALVLIAFAASTLPMWADYITVIRNTHCRSITAYAACLSSLSRSPPGSVGPSPTSRTRFHRKLPASPTSHTPVQEYRLHPPDGYSAGKWARPANRTIGGTRRWIKAIRLNPASNSRIARSIEVVDGPVIPSRPSQPTEQRP